MHDMLDEIIKHPITSGKGAPIALIDVTKSTWRVLTGLPSDFLLHLGMALLPMSHDIQSECENYPKIFCGILSVSHNTGMNMNNVMP
jgi:hypothetical protein